MNYIWAFLIIISFIVGTINGKLFDIVDALFKGAETSVNIAIGLCGIMVFWLGIMKIAEKSGIVNIISKFLQPIAKIIFTELKKDNNIIGPIAMNFTANALGLSNAATPMGLKAMEEMQKINKNKESASDSMCMFLAMNTAGFQLIPATVIGILVFSGAKNPTEIIVPTFIVTTIAFISAIVTAKIMQKIFPQQEIMESSGEEWTK